MYDMYHWCYHMQNRQDFDLGPLLVVRSKICPRSCVEDKLKARSHQIHEPPRLLRTWNEMDRCPTSFVAMLLCALPKQLVVGRKLWSCWKRCLALKIINYFYTMLYVVCFLWLWVFWAWQKPVQACKHPMMFVLLCMSFQKMWFLVLCVKLVQGCQELGACSRMLRVSQLALVPAALLDVGKKSWSSWRGRKMLELLWTGNFFVQQVQKTWFQL